VLSRHRAKLTEMGGFIDVLDEARVRIAPVAAAWAITAGRMVRADFERLASRIVEGAAGARPDILLMALHGAQCAAGEDDAEGSLLARLRAALGPNVPIVATLDLHANVTAKMAANADALVGYHTYPHVDMFETGQKAARLALRILSGEVKPAMAIRKIPMITNAENMQSTHGPFHRLIERAKALEASGEALAASVFGVQPWLDIHEMGNAVVVVTNGRPAAAARHAEALAARFWNSREEFRVRLMPVEEAIRRAAAVEGGPVVFAESSDSTGSGSPGDSTGALIPLLRADLAAPVAVFLVDPKAVARAVEAGVGATVTMKIGGGFDRRNSKPAKVTGYVRLISDGRWTARARGYNTGIETCMGRAVVLEVGQVRILIAERPAMTVDPELFRSHGIEPLYMKIVVVKSPNGFRAAYEPFAKAVFLVDTPGVSTANLASLPWKRLARPIYPLDPGTRFEP
jgi:microcystin degradation protein MlrC